MVCESDGDKPLALLHLMNELGQPPTVCFTASVEATHRSAAALPKPRSCDVAVTCPPPPPARLPRR